MSWIKAALLLNLLRLFEALSMSPMSSSISRLPRDSLIRRKNVDFPFLLWLAFTTPAKLPDFIMNGISIPFLLSAFLNLTSLTHLAARYTFPDPLHNLFNGLLTQAKRLDIWIISFSHVGT